MKKFREIIGKKKTKTEQPEQSNRGMMQLTYLAVFAFAALIFYEGWFLAVRREDVINNSYNARLDSFAERVVRGKILSSDGTVLAETLVDEEGNETRNYPALWVTPPWARPAWRTWLISIC